jgi:hypothetical protein
MKNLKIEAEKGFRRTLFEPELVDPNMEINFVKDSEGSYRLQVQLWVSIHRKGNSLNYTIHVNKEPGVTHDADLTTFSCNWRVFFSPSMEVLKFGPLKQLV